MFSYHSLNIQVPQNWGFSPVTSSYFPKGIGAQSSGTNSDILLLLPWVIKCLVSEPGVSCLLPASVRLWPAKVKLHFCQGIDTGIK